MLVLATGAHLSVRQQSGAQKPAEPSSPRPASSQPATIFKSQSDLVLVPAVVRSKGRFVTGLPREAFRLEENGKEQTISSFEEVRSPSGPPAVSADRSYSNFPFDNAGDLRLTIIVLDLLNTSPLQRADGRDVMVRFLENDLGPNQSVSLLCLTMKGLKLVHPFTSDTKALVEALKKYPLGPETVTARENRVFITIRELNELAQAYSGIPGRKSMIFAGNFLPEIVPESGILESSPYAADLHGMWSNLINANIAIYPYRIMDWARDPDRGRPPLHTIAFAEATGGRLCVESNELLRCLADAIDDSRAYYMLSFVIRPEDRKPGWHDLRVKVSLDHADVRARGGFYYRKPPNEDPKAAHEEILKALASPVPYSGVPMFVKVLSQSKPVEPAASPKSTIEFLLTLPLSGIDVDYVRPNPLDLEIGVIALTNEPQEVAEFSHDVRGSPHSGDLERWAHDGIVIKEQLDLPRGSFDLRFFTRDNNAGQTGTVVFPLEVN